jgi:hypothetical protein
MVISTIVFFAVAWYAHRYLDEREIPKGKPRSLLVFLLAYMLSWGAGEVVDRIQGMPEAAHASSGPAQF